MGILFRYKNALSSAEFNQRFADVIGKSVLQGFYFKEGTSPLSLSITAQGDESSLLITKTGARIEEFEELSDVLTLISNNTSSERIDTIYAKYEHGSRDATVEFVLIQGSNGLPAALQDERTHTLLGYVHVPPGASSIRYMHFVYPPRGFHLKKVANEVEFQSTAHFHKGIRVPDPLDAKDVVTKEYVDGKIYTDIQESFPHLSVQSNTFNENQSVYEMVQYKRKDGTLAFESKLSGLDAEGRFTKIVIKHFSPDGFTEVDSEEWRLSYDGFNNIASKVRV